MNYVTRESITLLHSTTGWISTIEDNNKDVIYVYCKVLYKMTANICMAFRCTDSVYLCSFCHCMHAC